MEPLRNFPPPREEVSAEELKRFAEKQKRLDELQNKLADMWRRKETGLATYKSLQEEATQLENEVSKLYKVVGPAAAAAKSDEEDAAELGKGRRTGPLGPTGKTKSMLGFEAGRRLHTRRRKHRNGPSRIQRHRASRVSRRKRPTRRS